MSSSVLPAIRRSLVLVLGHGLSTGDRTALGHVGIAGGCVDVRAVRVLREGQPVAEIRQHAPLEAAQHRCGAVGRAQRRQRILVAGVRPRMRVVALGQLEHQLVQVEAADQRQTGQLGLAARPLRAAQHAQLGFAGPGQQQRLEGHQRAAQRGARAPRSLRHQADAAAIAREHLHDQAGLLEGIAVQNVAGLGLAQAELVRHHSRVA